jgi:hypothetical protein
MYEIARKGSKEKPKKVRVKTAEVTPIRKTLNTKKKIIKGANSTNLTIITKV